MSRPLPPPLEFETPPCSVCGASTEYTDDQFRCTECGCTWGRDTAHLYEGRWDDRTAAQCPDVLMDREGLAVVQCMRTAGHQGDHVHPGEGEWHRDHDETPT